MWNGWYYSAVLVLMTTQSYYIYILRRLFSRDSFYLILKKELQIYFFQYLFPLHTFWDILLFLQITDWSQMVALIQICTKHFSLEVVVTLFCMLLFYWWNCTYIEMQNIIKLWYNVYYVVGSIMLTFTSNSGDFLNLNCYWITHFTWHLRWQKKNYLPMEKTWKKNPGSSNMFVLSYLYATLNHGTKIKTPLSTYVFHYIIYHTSY